MDFQEIMTGFLFIYLLKVEWDFDGTHEYPALSVNLSFGIVPDLSMETSTAFVIFQNSIKVPTPALPKTTMLVLLSNKYKKITTYMHKRWLKICPLFYRKNLTLNNVMDSELCYAHCCQHCLYFTYSTFVENFYFELVVRLRPAAKPRNK